MKKKLIVGVMGGGTAPAKDLEMAHQLGGLVAGEGWILLSGGRNAGIMDASLRGAVQAGGITVGILPDDNLSRASSHLTIPIVTGMGQARNVINVLSSDVVVACAGGAGTLSEVCLAVKYHKPVILLNFDMQGALQVLDTDSCLHAASTPEEVITLIKGLDLPSK